MPGILNGFGLGASGGGGGGGPLSINLLPGDPTNKFNPLFGGSSTSKQTANVSGGTPPYTYQWTRLSASDGISSSGETTSQLTLSATGNGGVSMNTADEEWECEATDAAMATASASFWMHFIFGAEEP